MDGARISVVMREDHLSKASVYRDLSVRDAAQFTIVRQRQSRNIPFWGWAKTPQDHPRRTIQFAVA
jgi:hypothetical protein